MEGRVIGSKDTAIEVGILFSLDFHAARIGIGANNHFQVIVLLFEIRRDVKLSSFEGSVDAAQMSTVEPHFGFPVDSVKI